MYVNIELFVYTLFSKSFTHLDFFTLQNSQKWKFKSISLVNVNIHKLREWILKLIIIQRVGNLWYRVTESHDTFLNDFSSTHKRGLKLRECRKRRWRWNISRDRTSQTNFPSVYKLSSQRPNCLFFLRIISGPILRLSLCHCASEDALVFLTSPTPCDPFVNRAFLFTRARCPAVNQRQRPVLRVAGIQRCSLGWRYSPLPITKRCNVFHGLLALRVLLALSDTTFAISFSFSFLCAYLVDSPWKPV